MKKYIYILIIIYFICFAKGLHANECSSSCKIADAPAPALTEYFTNIQTLQSNILEVLSDAESQIPEARSESWSGSQIQAAGERSMNAWKRLLQRLNGMLNFNDYFWSFDFKIALPITNQVPNEVKRDHRKLENISEQLTNILETSTRRNTSWTESTSICDGVSYCDIWEISMWNVLVLAIANNREIIRLYESSILDKAFLAENRNFILTSTDFEWQIQEYYNKDTLWFCSRCEGNSWAETTEQIRNISIRNSEYEAWLQQWKDAWALMRGGSPAHNATVENRVLSEYLGSQWIPWNQAAVVLDNLDRYGSGSISWSNPALNSENYASASITNTIDTFSQTLSEQFEGRERVPIIELAQVNSEIQSSEDLSLSIQSLYEDQLPFAQSQDISSQKLQLRILRMHASLVRSINELQGNRRLAEDLCDRQGTGMWRCSY